LLLQAVAGFPIESIEADFFAEGRDVPAKVPSALFDAREAGKCLAYELPTACGFHIFRATESATRGSSVSSRNKSLARVGRSKTYESEIRIIGNRPIFSGAFIGCPPWRAGWSRLKIFRSNRRTVWQDSERTGRPTGSACPQAAATTPHSASDRPRGRHSAQTGALTHRRVHCTFSAAELLAGGAFGGWPLL